MKSKKETVKKETVKKEIKKAVKGNAFQTPVSVSGKLKTLLGIKKALPRTEITKLAWSYAKAQNLKSVTESGDTLVLIDKGLNTLRNAEHPVKLGKKVSVYEFVRLFNSHIGS